MYPMSSSAFVDDSEKNKVRVAEGLSTESKLRMDQGSPIKWYVPRFAHNSNIHLLRRVSRIYTLLTAKNVRRDSNAPDHDNLSLYF